MCACSLQIQVVLCSIQDLVVGWCSDVVSMPHDHVYIKRAEESATTAAPSKLYNSMYVLVVTSLFSS